MEKEETFFDRLLKEEKELQERLGKLADFIESPKFNEIITDEQVRVLMLQQRCYMTKYLHVLKKRINILKKKEEENEKNLEQSN